MSIRRGAVDLLPWVISVFVELMLTPGSAE